MNDVRAALTHAAGETRVGGQQHDRFNEGRWVAGRQCEAAARVADGVCGLAMLRTNEHDRAAGGHRPVKLARHDDAVHLRLHRDQVNVGERERGMQPVARDGVEQPDVGEPFGIAGGLDFALPWSVAHEQEHDVGPLAQAAGCLEEFVEGMGQSQIARVHRDERSFEGERLAEGVGLARQGINLVATIPHGNGDDLFAGDLFERDAVSHVGPEHDDLVSSPVDRAAQGVHQPAEATLR